MAVALFSNAAKTFLSLSSSNTLTPSPQRHNASTQQLSAAISCCRATQRESQVSPSHSQQPIISLSKRSLALSLSSAFLLSLARKSEAAVLEAEDDLELLEKVKQDRKKRIERQGVINSSKQETGFLQDVVYKLSQVGQAIENDDLGSAGSVLGSSADTDWIKKANSAFSKLSLSLEEKAEVDVFNSSISELISSVSKKDVDSSKIAFVSSASAFEKWTALTGLGDKLKGL